MLLLGDNIEHLRGMADNSVDSVVTDPPYGLSFMGKRWDYDVPSVEFWSEIFRVLKPGGHVLSFGGTRTYHRMAVNIEDAGFEIRDQLQWLYGSGFPKSHNISKGIDKKCGAERKKIENPKAKQQTGQSAGKGLAGAKNALKFIEPLPATLEAEQWNGWGTALKPSNEPVCLARKPLSEKTIVNNVLKWGCGGLNIDDCRIGTDLIQGGRAGRSGSSNFNVSIGEKPEMHQGRWPANTLFDHAASEMLGEPSRFFYVAKASKSERNAGLDGMPTKKVGMSNGAQIHGESYNKAQSIGLNRVVARQNHHPTVKPIKLMRYLCRLITPPGGIVLDPFMGSGTTGIAAKREGFNFIGIELDPEYMTIAERRIESA